MKPLAVPGERLPILSLRFLATLHVLFFLVFLAGLLVARSHM